MNNIWVIVEHSEGKIKPTVLEALNPAKVIARQRGGTVTAVFLGFEESDVGENLIQRGADRVLFLKNKELDRFSVSGYLASLVPIIKNESPRIILLAATTHGRELAPALAAKLNAGLATDCTELNIDSEGEFQVRRPIYGGRAISTLAFNSSTIPIVTLRPNIFRDEVPDKSKKGEFLIHESDLTDSLITCKVKKIISEPGTSKDISEARIIVSGGMGMQKPENFHLIEELAGVLGGAVGASRPVVDNGWRNYSNQVGQTGRTVSPDLYIACGISGAVQHQAGMSSSNCIVAINKDPYAPIFQIADYGIVGDVLEVLPILTEEFRKALS